jgi:pyrroloquinoline quinone biosynthesis protein D
VSPDDYIRRPLLARHARYRWDALRKQHQIVYPEGVLVLNETGAAIVRHCDGRTREALIAELKSQFKDGDPAADVDAFIDRLSGKGLVRDAADD